MATGAAAVGTGSSMLEEAGGAPWAWAWATDLAVTGTGGAAGSAAAMVLVGTAGLATTSWLGSSGPEGVAVCNSTEQISTYIADSRSCLLSLKHWCELL